MGMADLSEIAALVNIIHREVRKLAEVVHEGNGKEPLVTRVAVIERELQAIDARLAQSAAHRWQIVLAMVSAIASFIVSVGLYVIQRV